MPTLPRYLSTLAAAFACLILAWGNALAKDPENDESDETDEATDVVEEVIIPTPYRLAKLESLVQQPPPARRTPSLADSTGRSTSTLNRLARSPNMFGNSQLLIRGIEIGPGSGNTQDIRASFASNAVGSRRIGENDKVMPMDRIFVGYNEFHGMAPPLSSPFTPPTSAQMSRCTLGFEKTFLDGWWSLETRIAASGSPDMVLPGIGGSPPTRYDGGTPSALTFYLKKLCALNSTTAIGAGLGLGVPITSDVILSLPNDTLRYREQTTHLMPYIGFLSMPSDDWFFQGFLQFDFAAGDNQLESMPSGRPSQHLASLAEQQLFFADLSLGRWLYRDLDAPVLSGLAAVFEIHYLTTLNDSSAPTVMGPPLGPGGGLPFNGTYTLTNLGNRLDVVDLTAGVQLQFGALSNLRIAGVAPVTTGFNRFFDGELQVSFNRQF